MGMDIGGAETHILELAKELKRRNHEVFVASNGGKYVEELNQSGIEHIWAPLNNKNPKNVLKSYQILKDLIQNKKIELVHSHTRITSFICGKLQKRLHFPFVTTDHGVFKITPLLKMITDWGDATIAVSEDIKDYLMQNYRIDENQIVVTVNGIDIKKFSKETDTTAICEEFHLEKEAPKIVHISRLDSETTLVAHQLIDIMPEIAKQYPNIKLIMVGGGTCFEEVKKCADEMNQKLGKNSIIMTNSRTDVNQFAALGDVFVGLSRAALEAMASERPVILAGNQGYLGIFDEAKQTKAIETNFCCRGLEMPKKERLKEDILTILSQHNNEEMGEFNRNIVKEFYSIEKMTNDCEKAYQMVKK